MITHLMKLAKDPFQKIVNGQKIIESRLYDEKRQAINIGDQIEFKCNNNNGLIKTKVKALYRYQFFNELFSDFPCGYFGGCSKETLLEEIHQFYSIQEEERYGVIGIKLELEK